MLTYFENNCFILHFFMAFLGFETNKIWEVAHTLPNTNEKIEMSVS